MLAWLYVCSEVQTCIWPSWCHCHSLSLASVKSRLVPAHLGSPGQRAVKRVCVCVIINCRMAPEVIMCETVKDSPYNYKADIWSFGQFFILWLLIFSVTEKKWKVNWLGWPSSRVDSVLDWGAEGPGFKSLSVNSLRQTVHTHCASVHQAAKLAAVLLRIAGATTRLAESNGSLLSGLWFTSPTGWLPRTGISSRTICSVIEYGLRYLFFKLIHTKAVGQVLVFEGSFEEPMFDRRPFRFRVTTLGKLFTHMCLCHQAV